MHSSGLPIFATVLASLAAFGQAAWDPNRPAVFSQATLNQADTDLAQELPSHNDRSAAWDAGWIPKYCYNEAVSHGLSPFDFEVRNVYYTDCAAPWAMCRYRTASKSWSTIIDVSQNPPKLTRIPSPNCRGSKSVKCQWACGNILPTF